MSSNKQKPRKWGFLFVRSFGQNRILWDRIITCLTSTPNERQITNN